MQRKVLVIDDSVAIHQLVKVHLEEESLDVHSMYDGASGLRTAAALKPNLILLDLDLPDMNGFDVCRFLKAGRETAEIPIIFVSGSDSIDAKVCGLDLLAADFVTKPFVAVELCARVRAALRIGQPNGTRPDVTATATTDMPVATAAV